MERRLGRAIADPHAEVSAVHAEDGGACGGPQRRQPELQKIPIAILTNIDNPKDRADFMKKGAVGYFTKTSLTPAQVVEEVQTLLSHG